MKRLLQQRPSVQAQKRHEAVAVVFQGQRVSYGELENESNQLAKMLVEAGCKRGDRIALMVPKSPAAIIGMLGTLKADCMYVPVDTSMPAA
jgi:non-ribosomal peptide synthetase component F